MAEPKQDVINDEIQPSRSSGQEKREFSGHLDVEDVKGHDFTLD
jgi:hypothetical protein